MTLSPGIIRTTARNRVDNQPTCSAVANRGRQRKLRLQPDLPTSPVTPRTGRRPTDCPVSRGPPYSDGGVAAAEATVRAAIGDRGKNGSGASPAAAAVIRHRRTSQLVIEPIVHDCSEHCRRRRLRQHVRVRVVFPRRRTGAKAQPCRHRYAGGSRLSSSTDRVCQTAGRDSACR